jgi:ABC-type phosphate transport system substrate-binding protein
MRLFLLCLALLALPAWADTPLANITDDQTTISRQDVGWMYTMRTRYWADGARITVYNLPHSSPVHRSFVRNVLNTSPITYQQVLERQINAGNASQYRTVRNEIEMLARLANTYGAIGYVSADALLIHTPGGLRALRIVD